MYQGHAERQHNFNPTEHINYQTMTIVNRISVCYQNHGVFYQIISNHMTPICQNKNMDYQVMILDNTLYYHDQHKVS